MITLLKVLLAATWFVFMGFFLAIGFWAGTKATHAIDRKLGQKKVEEWEKVLTEAGF